MGHAQHTVVVWCRQRGLLKVKGTMGLLRSMPNLFYTARSTPIRSKWNWHKFGHSKGEGRENQMGIESCLKLLLPTHDPPGMYDQGRQGRLSCIWSLGCSPELLDATRDLPWSLLGAFLKLQRLPVASAGFRNPPPARDALTKNQKYFNAPLGGSRNVLEVTVHMVWVLVPGESRSAVTRKCDITSRSLDFSDVLCFTSTEHKPLINGIHLPSPILPSILPFHVQKLPFLPTLFNWPPTPAPTYLHSCR